jgi:hypothetical protein
VHVPVLVLVPVLRPVQCVTGSTTAALAVECTTHVVGFACIDLEIKMDRVRGAGPHPPCLQGRHAELILSQQQGTALCWG